MENPTGIQDEHSKSLLDFGLPNHMAMFGRRLWFAYTDDPQGMSEIARLKLTGGKQKGEYDPKIEHHVFAALSFRLSLDPCMHNPKTIPLIRTAVNSHMRVVVSMDEEAGTMHTTTPSEPILAKAAMEHLCIGSNWALSIGTLVKNLLDKGLVEKGLKGELYARLLLTLAHDSVRLRGHARSQALRLELMKPFTVQDFLEELYAENHHEFIKNVEPQILEARMNFTHFVPAHENLPVKEDLSPKEDLPPKEDLSPMVIPDLLHELLRRSAALQLAPNQPTYDTIAHLLWRRERGSGPFEMRLPSGTG